MWRGVTYMRSVIRLSCVLAFAFALVGSTSTAWAHGSTSTTTVTAVSAPLRLNCTTMTKEARAYATKHRLCPSGSGGVQPDDTVFGNCGSSTLFVNQGYASGIARFDEAVGSTLGGITRVNYNLAWMNWSTTQGYSYNNGQWNWGTTWTNSDYFNTQLGYVTGSLGGYVVLVWGGTCDILNPGDGATIN